mgnify:CR=1 FL=1
MKRRIVVLVSLFLLVLPGALPAARLEASRMRVGRLGDREVREFSGSVVFATPVFRLSGERLLLFDGGVWEAPVATATEMAGLRIEAGSARGRGPDGLEWNDGRLVFPALGAYARFSTCRLISPGRFVLDQVTLHPPGTKSPRVVARLSVVVRKDGVRCELPGESLFIPVPGRDFIRNLAGRFP